MKSIQKVLGVSVIRKSLVLLVAGLALTLSSYPSIADSGETRSAQFADSGETRSAQFADSGETRSAQFADSGETRSAEA